MLAMEPSASSLPPHFPLGGSQRSVEFFSTAQLPAPMAGELALLESATLQVRKLCVRAAVICVTHCTSTLESQNETEFDPAVKTPDSIDTGHTGEHNPQT